jgi:hypothetical protein
MRVPNTLTTTLAAFLIGGLPFCGAAHAGSDHGLFNPTPAAEMRELSTDRPDKTESPYTVDAGHFQLETDLVSYTHDRVKNAGEDSTTNSFAVAPVNLKVGLADNIDLQIVIDTYLHDKTTDHLAGTVDRASGFGDITVRTKFNLWGNNGGKTAFAIMPFIKLPTASRAVGNGKVEGGIILPLAIELPNGFGLGVMTEVDVNHNETASGYHAEWVNSVTVSHDIAGSLGMYVELFTARIFEPGAHRWDNTADVGFTYALTPNVQFDAGVNFGLSEAADDINPFIGLSVRW